MAFEAGANIPPIKVYPDKFEGQVVVITGGANGIGEVTAKLFASEGAMVVVLDIVKDKLIQVQFEIEAGGGKATYRTCNVLDDKQVTTVIDDIVSTYGKIDILVHLAGIFPFVPITNMSTEDYHQVIGVNMDASFYMARAVLPHMRKQGYGRIINTSSGTLQLPAAGLSAYVAAKSAIVGFTRTVAIEAGPGITANIIMPGLIKTDIAAKMHADDGLFDALLEKQCVKRNGRPEDIAHTINFIASPEAQFITGQIFDCGGGATWH